RRYSLRRDWHWLQGDMGKGFAQSLSGGKRASRRLLSELVNGTWNDGAGAVRPARIYHKQIACAVKGQTLCAARHRTKSRSRIPMENSRRFVSVDDAAVVIRHKQIACLVHDQVGRVTQPGRKDG